jgi:hypothetical protein
MMALVSKAHKIRIYSKKLPSGKCQVKFYLTTQRGNPYYGYLLVESGRTVRNVVETILEKLDGIDQPDAYYHKHLYNVGRKSDHDLTFMVFNLTTR